MESAFATLVADGMAGSGERFSLLDLGCSGGIDPRWRAFRWCLRAIAVDASDAECARLRALETNSDVEYVAAFVAGAPNSKIDLTRGQASPLIMRIRDRLSFMRSREIRAGWLAGRGTEVQLRHNAWEMTRLADPSKPIDALELLAARRWTDLDYLKIDIDGSDFDVLRTFDGKFGTLGVLGVQLEVNFVGSDDPSDHTFHNTDRFMRRQGFELFRLDVRNYSSRVLPARYVWPTPAETVSGRPFQGEAYYARDIDADISRFKLAKLAAIFSLWNVPDVAAELLSRREVLTPHFNTDRGLDLLARQVQPDRFRKLNYRSYLRTFEDDARWFYRREGNVSLMERVGAAWRAFRSPRG